MVKHFLPVLLLLVLFSCKKEITILQPESINEYYPLEIGNYIDYNLDSTVFVSFGTIRETRSYLAREIVEDTLTDNASRKSYKVTRYIRKTTADNWASSITYLVTPTKNTIEVLENNLRYIKLAFPLKNGLKWKGNKYIDTYSTELGLNYMNDWNYTYDSLGAPLTIGSVSFDNTLGVFAQDEFLGQDPTIPGTLYAERNLALEKYAKGVGLIYREFLHWTYQGEPPAYFEGYGIKMTATGYGKL